MTRGLSQYHIGEQQLWSIEILIKLSEKIYEFRTKLAKELVLSEKKH